MIRHILKIDDEDAIELAAESRIAILLNEGTHRLRFSSTGSVFESTPYRGYSVFKDNFYLYGQIKEIEVNIQEGKKTQIKYVAPFWNNEPGIIRILN